MPKASNKKTTLRESLSKHLSKASSIARAKHGQKNSYVATPTRKVKKGARAEIGATLQAGNGPARSFDIKGDRNITIPFKPECRVLLVGEGNFSFSRSLLVTESILVSPSLLVATCYDSEEVCYSKYPEAKGTVLQLRTLGATVHFGVDATRLDKYKELKKHAFDNIVFNFPHVGAGIKDQDRNIHINQQLILGFLQSSAGLLAKGVDPTQLPSRGKKKRRKQRRDEDESEDEEEAFDIVSDDEESQKPGSVRGSILITLRDAIPYTLWNIPRLAKSPPIVKPYPVAHSSHRYSLLRSFAFHPEAYPEYEHRRTLGGATGFAPNEDLKKANGACRTWEFVLRDPEASG